MLAPHTIPRKREIIPHFFAVKPAMFCIPKNKKSPEGVLIEVQD